ncbi:unnamed protein product [Amaranthus hypochondriacus]
MDEIKFIGHNNPEDVRWLFSLSETELDLLISLKKLAHKRALCIGHESLAQNFDLKTLRVLGFIVMQQIKEQVDGLQLTGLNGSNNLFDGCNLLKLDLENRVETREQEPTGEVEKATEEVKTRSSTKGPKLKRKRNVMVVEAFQGKDHI